MPSLFYCQLQTRKVNRPGLGKLIQFSNVLEVHNNTDPIILRPGHNVVILKGAAQGDGLVRGDGRVRGQGREAEEEGQEGGQDAAGPREVEDAEQAEQEV